MKQNINKLGAARFDGKITGENVRRIRTELELTQSQFADLLKYGKGGQSKISEIENNKRELTNIQIELLYWYSLATLNNS